MVYIFKALFGAVWPRREAFETDQFYIWRAILGAVTFFVAGALTMNYALAFGAISVFGFTGFAQASEVSDLVKQQQIQYARLDRKGDEIMATVISGQISETRFRQCTAIKAKNDDLVRSLSEELQGRLDAYQAYKGRSYNLQSCP